MPTGTCLRMSEVREIRRLRYEDGLTAPEVAERMGLGETTVLRYAPGKPGKVANERLREAFEASGVTGYDLATRIGWTYQKGQGARGDGARLKRALGILPSLRTGRPPAYHRWIDAETAYRIADELGVDRFDLEENVPEGATA